MQLQTMLRFRAGWAEAEGPENAVVLSTRVRLARNLRQPFTTHASPAGLKRVLEQSFSAAKAAGLKDAAFFKLADLDDTDRAFLVERQLASPALVSAPSHRGVVVGERESLMLMVNEEDHLRLAAILPGQRLKEAHAAVDRLDDGLAGTLDFAFRDDLGYLTACPTNLGTGMRASCLVHLPALALTGHQGRLIESLTKAGLVARGMHGEGTKVLGDFFQVSNATGFGRTEGEILAALERAVAAITARETEARDHLSAGAGRTKLEDEVYRSAGALATARVLPFEEAQQHLSRLRLGVALGWKLPVDLSLVNELMLSTQPAHLDLLAEKVLAPFDRDVLRAALVRRRLKALG